MFGLPLYVVLKWFQSKQHTPYLNPGRRNKENNVVISKREIMQHVLPAGKVFQAGTLSGNPIATAAGIAMLTSLRDNPPYARLEEVSQRLADGLSNAARSAGVEHCLHRVGSMMTLFFAPGPIVDWDSASKCNTDLFSKYFWGLIERGVYMPCSQFEALFVSAAHSDQDIDHTIAMAKEVFADLD